MSEVQTSSSVVEYQRSPVEQMCRRHCKLMEMHNTVSKDYLGVKSSYSKQA